jgi:CheY-like chemotaxis protein
MAGESILVVDDNPMNLRLLNVVLTNGGYQVHSVGDPLKALELLEQLIPDLILVDLQMPGMDGLEPVRRLRTNVRTKDLPIVAVTAYAMKGDEEKALRAGCDGYVTKPIDTRGFLRIVERHLQARPTRPGPFR